MILFFFLLFLTKIIYAMTACERLQNSCNSYFLQLTKKARRAMRDTPSM